MPWFILACMALAAYRLTRLITRDDFPPLLWLRDRLSGGWRPLTLAELERYNLADATRKAMLRTDWSYDPDDELHQRYVARQDWVPVWLSELYGCPWCVSAYVSGALTLAVDLTVGLPVPWLVGVAVWALAALLASREWA